MLTAIKYNTIIEEVRNTPYEFENTAPHGQTIIVTNSPMLIRNIVVETGFIFSQFIPAEPAENPIYQSIAAEELAQVF